MSVLEEDIDACFPALRQPPAPTVDAIAGLSPIKATRVKPLEVSFLTGGRAVKEPGRLSRRSSTAQLKRVLSSSDTSPPKAAAPHQMDFQPTKLTGEEQVLVQDIWQRRVGSGPEAHVSSAEDLIKLLERLGISEVGAIRRHLGKLFTVLTVDGRGNASSKLFFGQFLDILQRCKTLTLVVQARRMHESWKDVRSPVRSRQVESVHRSRHLENHLSEGDLLQVFGALSQQPSDSHQSPRKVTSDLSSTTIPAETSRTDSQLLSAPTHLEDVPRVVSAQRLDEFAKQYNLFPQALIPADYLMEVAGPSTDDHDASTSLTEHPSPLDLVGADARAHASLGDTVGSHILLGSLDGVELIDEVRPAARPGSSRAAVLDPRYRDQQVTTEDLSALLQEGGDEDKGVDSLDEEANDEVGDMWANNPHCSAIDPSDGLSYWEEAEALSAAYAPPNRRKGDTKGSLPQNGLLVQPVDEFLTNTQRKCVFSSLKEPNSTTVLFNKRKAEKAKALAQGHVVRAPTRAEKADQWELRREEKLKKNEEVIANATKFLKEKFSTLKSTR
jgi:hypothetical protein